MQDQYKFQEFATIFIILSYQMYSRILRQPSQLDIAFQYLWRQQLLGSKQPQPLLPNKKEKTLPSIKDHIQIDFFGGDPVFIRPKNTQKQDDESSEPEDPGQNQESQMEIQVDKEAQMTREHLDENPEEKRREPYPTKNILPAFKPSFLSYLAKNFDGEYFKSIPIIASLNKKKNAITLRDYQDLFNFEEFRPILECYFADREIYRYLMMSRINSKRKRIYLRKIHVFQEAFHTRIFDKIN